MNLMQRIKIICACGVAVLILAASLQAQPPTASPPAAHPTPVVAAPAGSAAPAHAEPGGSLVPSAAPVLFQIGPLPVTNSMVCTWIVAALIFVIIRATTWRISEVPGGGQNVMEMLVEGWSGLMGDILEPKVTRWVFPFATTFFIFIIISNFVDLIPGVGTIGFGAPDKNSSLPLAIDHVARPFFRPPTTDANLTVAMAGLFLLMNLFWALRYNGPVGLVKHIFGVKMKTSKWALPFFLLLFFFVGLMEVMSIVLVRPVALAMRLYGNIFGGENMLHQMLNNKSFILSVISALPFYFYEVFVCILQAFVFALLTIAFVGTICTPADEEH